MKRPPLQEPRARGETSIARILPALASLPAQRRGVAVPPRSVHPAGDRARRRHARRDRDLLRARPSASSRRPRSWARRPRSSRIARDPGIGGLLNVTFGNAPEIIIALFALGKGLQEVVKASLVGSILGNILLVLGAADVRGRHRARPPAFNRTAASAQSAMLLLAVAALVMPAVYELSVGKGLPSPDRGARRLRLHRRAPLADRGDHPDGHLWRGAGLLAADAPRPVQPAAAEGGGGRRGGAVVGAALGRHARHRGRRGRRHVGDPRQLDLRGRQERRPVRVLHRGRSSSPSSATPPSTGWRCYVAHKDKMDLAVNIADRLERADRAVRDPAARPALVRDRRLPDAAGVQRLRARRRSSSPSSSPTT